MALTVLSDVVMPNNVIQAGVTGKQIRQNSRVQNQGGYVSAAIIWSNTLRQFDIGIAPMLVSQWQAINAIFEITAGGAYGFLMEDPVDCLDNGGGVLNAQAIGGAYRTFKRYMAAGSSRYQDRLITRPKTPINVYRNGSAVTLGSGAGNAAIDYTTGTVTFVADSSQALTSITVGSSTVLNFANGTGIVAAVVVGQSVYLSGVTGTAASVLNGLPLTITAKGSTSLTVSVATTGLTASGGTASKYPQGADVLTWTGGFYVPVQFSTDEIDWHLEVAGDRATRFASGPSVQLTEIREA